MADGRCDDLTGGGKRFCQENLLDSRLRGKDGKLLDTIPQTGHALFQKGQLELNSIPDNPRINAKIFMNNKVTEILD